MVRHQDELRELGRSIVELEARCYRAERERDALREALILLARLAYQPYGAYSRDQLEMANSCLEAMKKDAETVLLLLRVEPTGLSQDEYYKFEDEGFATLAASKEKG